MSRYQPLSPGLVGLDSERVVLLRLVADWALGLGISGKDEFEDGGGSGADFLLVRGFESCEGSPLRAVDSRLEPVRLGTWDGSSDEGTENLAWGNTGGGIVFIAI